MKIIRFLNDSNILVALAAASLTAGTFVIAGMDIYFMLIAQSFFLTWAGYLFLKDPPMRSKRIMIYTAVTGSTLCLLTTHFFAWPLILVTGLVVLLYKLETLLPKNARLRFSLRNIPFVKSIAIGISWALLTSAVPAGIAEYEKEIPCALMIYSNFFLVTALALAGDIRDAAIDMNKLKTAPGIIGVKWAKAISVILLLLSSLIFSMTWDFHSPNVSIAFYLAMAATAVMVLLLNPKKNWQIQAFFIDGMMIVRLLAIGMASQL